MRIFSKLLLAGIIISAPSLCVRAELANRIAAIVSDSIITSQQVETFIGQAAMGVQDQYGNRPELYRKQMLALMNNGLETLVQFRLILHDFDTLQGKVPESIIDTYVEDQIHDRFSDRVQFSKMLQKEGLTKEQYRKQVRDRLIIDDMTHQYVKEPIISPHKIEAYYNAHREDYKVEDQVKTRMIVLNQPVGETPGTARKRAEEILSQIKAGAVFEEMAKVYSDGSQRLQGGENGWQEVAVLNKALVEPVTKLKAGECSAVIETPEACFLILLEERRPAHYKPLNELRQEVERNLMGQEAGRLQKLWIDRLKKKTFVRYF
ncbi:MAG: surA [Pedosphaera sp.]|nr:surA [Pedosphaera sp.]